MKLLTSRRHLSALINGVTIGLVGLTSCTNYSRDGAVEYRDERSGVSIRADDVTSVNAWIDKLSNKRVVAVGELHDRYDHHAVQLAVIAGLKQRGVDFAVGLEAFQSHFQPYLDDYIRGELSEQAMLDKTEYRARWGFDYRLYQPIVEFAKKNGIPLLALNAPSELVAEISRTGYRDLKQPWREQLPKVIAPPDSSYKNRLKSAFKSHKMSDLRGFDRFLSVQLLWDEYMAEIAANDLRRNPERNLVILAGLGHLRYGSGIPERIYGRTGLKTNIVLSGAPGEVPTGAADVIFLTEPKSLAGERRSAERLVQRYLRGSNLFDSAPFKSDASLRL